MSLYAYKLKNRDSYKFEVYENEKGFNFHVSRHYHILYFGWHNSMDTLLEIYKDLVGQYEDVFNSKFVCPKNVFIEDNPNKEAEFYVGRKSDMSPRYHLYAIDYTVFMVLLRSLHRYLQKT